MYKKEREGKKEKDKSTQPCVAHLKGGPTSIAKRGISEFGNSFSSPSGAQAYRRKRRERRKFPS